MPSFFLVFVSLAERTKGQMWLNAMVTYLWVTAVAHLLNCFALSYCLIHQSWLLALHGISPLKIYQGGVDGGGAWLKQLVGLCALVAV